jgi:hypothetical protein
MKYILTESQVNKVINGVEIDTQDGNIKYYSKINLIIAKYLIDKLPNKTCKIVVARPNDEDIMIALFNEYETPYSWRRLMEKELKNLFSLNFMVFERRCEDTPIEEG